MVVPLLLGLSFQAQSFAANRFSGLQEKMAIESPELSSGPRDASGKRFDVAATLHLALEHSSEVQSALNAQQMRELELRNAGVAFLPTLDFDFRSGFQRNDPDTLDSPWVNEANLQLNQSLYDNGVSLVRQKIARVLLEMAQKKYAVERERVSFAVLERYAQYSQAVYVSKLSEERLAILREQLRSMSHQYEQGVKPKKDLVRLQTEVERAELDRAQTSGLLQKNKIDLRELLGIPHAIETDQLLNFVPLEIAEKKVSPTGGPSVVHHDHEEFKKKEAREFNLEVFRLESQVQRLETNTFAPRFLPELYLSLGGTYHNGDFVGIGDAVNRTDWSWNTFLTLKFNLMDWGLRHRNLQLAEMKFIEKERALQKEQLRLDSEIEKVLLDSDLSIRKLDLSRKILSLEEQNFKMLELEFRNGKVSSLEVIYSLRELINARTQFYTQYFEDLVLRFRRKMIQGELYVSFQK